MVKFIALIEAVGSTKEEIEARDIEEAKEIAQGFTTDPTFLRGIDIIGEVVSVKLKKVV